MLKKRFLTLFALATVCGVQAQTPPVPLSINGTFDAPAPNWKFVAEGWGRTGYWGKDVAPNDIKREMDAKNPYIWVTSGAGSAKGTVLAVLAQPVLINPAWKQLKITFRSRLTDLQAGTNRWQTARLQVSFKTEDGNAINTYPSVYIEPSTDWSSTEGTVKIAPGAHTFTIEFGFWNSVGNLDMDDIVVMPVM